MRVCAIVLDYRGARRVEQCIAQLAGSVLDTIYVVDNNVHAEDSVDLKRVLKPYSHVSACPQVVLVTVGDNLGFSRGVNLVVRHDAHTDSPHDAYLLINSDAIATGATIEQLILLLADNPKIDAIAPAEQSGARTKGPNWYNRVTGLVTSRKWPLSFPYLSGCCVLVRRCAVRDGTLLDEDFFMYGEDVALSWRLLREGRGIHYADQVYVYHEGNAAAKNGSLFYEYHINRSHILLAIKLHRNVLEVPFTLTVTLLVLIARGFVRAIRFGSFVPLAALVLSVLPIRIRPV